MVKSTGKQEVSTERPDHRAGTGTGRKGTPGGAKAGKGVSKQVKKVHQAAGVKKRKRVIQVYSMVLGGSPSQWESHN